MKHTCDKEPTGLGFWLPDLILPDINLLSGKPDFAGPEPVLVG